MTKPKQKKQTRRVVKQRNADDHSVVTTDPGEIVAMERDPIKPDMAWVLQSGSGTSERQRRDAIYRAHQNLVHEAARDDVAKVYQMSFWADDKRAMPLDFIACALFAAVQTKHAPYMRGEQIASHDGYTITCDPCLSGWLLDPAPESHAACRT